VTASKSDAAPLRSVAGTTELDLVLPGLERQLAGERQASQKAARDEHVDVRYVARHFELGEPGR
jgi:hypothetical protein